MAEKTVKFEVCEGPPARGTRASEVYDIILDGARGAKGHWVRTPWRDLGFKSAASLGPRVKAALESRMLDPTEMCETAQRGDYLYVRVFEEGK